MILANINIERLLNWTYIPLARLNKNFKWRIVSKRKNRIEDNTFDYIVHFDNPINKHSFEKEFIAYDNDEQLDMNMDKYIDWLITEGKITN